MKRPDIHDWVIIFGLPIFILEVVITWHFYGPLITAKTFITTFVFAVVAATLLYLIDHAGGKE